MEKPTATGTPPKPAGKVSILPILIAAALGIFTGLFFGDYTRFLRPIGQGYLMLLEVAVYPYLIASLLHGLSSMTPVTAWRLFRVGWPFYLFIWGITFGLLWLLGLSFPQPLPSTLPVSGDSSALSQQLLALLIPNDFFASLSQNYVPAVVLFCIFFGIAFQQVKEKQAMLSILDGIRQASLVFWKFIVRLMPFAVFALLADSAGTFRLHSLDSVGLYLFLFVFGVLLLSFWLIPACISALTPIKYREVLDQLGTALTLSFVTTLPVTALPNVIEATQEFARRCGVEDPERDEVIKTHISVAYPLAQLGNYFVYLFIIFVAFFMGKSITSAESIILPVITLLSCCGTPASSVNALSFMSSAFDLPASGVNLYVELMTITRYAMVIASVMGYASLSFLVVLAYYGKLKIRWLKLAGVVASGAFIALGAAISVRAVITHYLDHTPNPYLTFTLDPELTRNVEVTYEPADGPPYTQSGPGETVMQRVQRTGVLRVGYNDGVIPFCYRNNKGDLVGYDVAFAYKFAKQINAKIKFVPFKWEDLDAVMKDGELDIAMSGIYLTRDRLINLDTSTPYFQSPLAFFTLRNHANDFLSRDQIQARPDLRLGAFNGSILIPILQNTFPRNAIVPDQTYATVPDFSRVDGALWSLTQAEALAAAHPQLIAVPTRDLGNPVLFVYLVPPHSDDFLKLVNYWLLVNRDSGFEKQQHDYWIERQPRPDLTPRWSLLRQMTGK
jgi:Na+/H+-dicarboxylate symporter/ABC-type amino acid transport substrate-binding protein